jgi:hypothetical protein
MLDRYPTEFYNYFSGVANTSRKLNQEKTIFEIWNVTVKDYKFYNFEMMEKVILKNFLKGIQ